ncbi:MAG TPA: glycoside hydrolase [Anaerolineae bacterium]|nr:glycoside hydrolase [Anaerolineae bacterium]
METDVFHLLPYPQQLVPGDGTYVLRSDRFILLQDDPGPLLIAGQKLQAGLAEAGIRWQLTAARGNRPDLIGAAIHVDPAQVPQRQGYHLIVTPEQIRIVSHDPAGAFYGVATLIQLLRQHSKELPCLRIEDYPDYPARGVMLDISRDKVPTMETLYNLVDMLAGWKVNQLQLYTEHTFAYRNHREVWAEASPMTGEEILALDVYCRERFIELVPNQNSFGHMHHWLKHPRYRPLAEAPDGFDFPWGGHSDEPFSLCPEDPGSLELLRELYAELLPHFSSRQFNVGCDETFDLGQGRSKGACEERGVGRVYLEFLQKIHVLVQEHGRTMQFWGDIIMRYPELIPELPGDVIALEWGYEADHPFDADGAKFAAAGVPFYVCPGTSSWNSIAGRTDNAIGNLQNAAINGRKHSAIGYLNTDWGDNGHLQHLSVSYLGFAYGAALGWAEAANRDLDLPTVLDLFAFRDRAGVMGRLAYDLGNAYKAPGVEPHNSSVLALILLRPDWTLEQGRMVGITVDGLRQALDYIDGVMERLPQSQMQCWDAALVADEFRNAAALLRFACKLGIARLETPNSNLASVDQQTRQMLATELEELIAEYKRLWLARNRPGGLKDSVRRLNETLRKLQS